MSGALFTDLYEITMALSYLRHGMTAPATFSLFVRNLPRDRGFLVAAGLEDCLAFLERFRFERDDVEYVRTALALDSDAVEGLAELRFSGDVWAMPEGSIAFANEPLLEVTAPIAQAQLVETALLNFISFQTAVATKAARCVLAARGKGLADFSFRRTQSLEAGIAAARAAAIAGFNSTSNVEAARRYALECSGTMAHSYVEAFANEEQAFRTFAGDFPERTTFLVDTYDTVAGVQTAIRVISALKLVSDVGIRLDSGDLDALAHHARRLLDDTGLQSVRIFASGGLDEYEIDELTSGGAPIDAFGVGTKMGVSADAPYLDSAYKLVEFDGRPVLKLSVKKATLPGAKQVFRHRQRCEDIIALREEVPPYDYEPCLRPVMTAGARVAASESVDAIRNRCAAQLARLPDGAKRFRDPIVPIVRISAELEGLAKRSRRAIERQIAPD